MSILETKRASTKARINFNPFTITDGEYVQDTTNEMSEDIKGSTLVPWTPGSDPVVRIAKNNDRQTIPQRSGDNTPNEMSETYYMIHEYDAIIPKGLTFTFGEKKLRTKQPEPVVYLNEVAYFRTQLEEVTRYV